MFERLKKFKMNKTLSMFLVVILSVTLLLPLIESNSQERDSVQIGGIDASRWNAMTEQERESFFDKLSKAIGNSGAGVMVGGWTNGAAPVKILPVSMDGTPAYCMQPQMPTPIGTYYADPEVSQDSRLRSVTYHGYPNNATSLQQKYGLTNTRAEQYTQFAVWKILGHVGPGKYFADRTHPYVDELISLSNAGDVGPYTTIDFNISTNYLEAQKYPDYQETGVINTSGSPGTFAFPSNNDIWSVDVNGNPKNTFNIGESFKVRSTTRFNGVSNLDIVATLNNPNALVYNGKGAYQNILQFAWGDKIQKHVNLDVKFTALGIINIQKKNDKGQNLKGVKFGLFSDKDATNLIKESVTDDSGNIVFSDLDEGTYYIKELATIPGHILSTEIKEVNVTLGTVSTFEWINDTIKSIVKFFKYDEETKKPMANVEFKIQALTGLDQGKEWTMKTDETGYFTTELAYGDYQIVEVKTLEGYVLNNEPIKFSVNENGQTIELSMANKRIKSTIKFLKIDSKTGKPLPNVKFKIKAIDGLLVGNEMDVVTDNNGYIIMELPYGNYEIVEVETLEGYILNTEPIKFTVNKDGQTIELSMSNDRVEGSAEILKIDSDTKEPLANVEFKIECLTGFNKGDIFKVITNDDGIAKLDNLEYGKYRVIEIKPLHGYVIDTTPYDFEINNNGDTIKLEIENIRIKGKLEIKKVDSNSSKPLKGAQFGIYDINKDLIEVIESDENGIALSSELHYGQYYYKELVAPNGYQVDSNFYEFNIKDNNQIVKVEFKNYTTISYKKNIEPKKWSKIIDALVPKTGDSKKIGLAIITLLVSSVGLIWITRRK